MDGSVSTLAPLFAAAFATHNTWETFLVGLAASVGAGISMGFAEALSDDGSLTGRGTPWLRGSVCGVMTDDRRHRPHPALPHSRFLDRDDGGDRRRGGRACRHFVDTPSLHGHAFSLRSVSGHGRWRVGLPRRNIDRQLLMFILAHLSDVHLAPLPRPNPLELLSQARARLSQLAAQAAPDPPRRHAGQGGRRSQSPRARPHRGHRRSRQSLARERVRDRRAPGWKTLGDPSAVTVVPGNHDRYVRAAVDLRRAALGAIHARRRQRATFRSSAAADRSR